MNQFKNNTTPEDKSTGAAGQMADDALKKASDFSFFVSRESIGKALPAIIMGVVVAIFYISLSHFHVKSLKEKEELKVKLNELRSEYISVKSRLMKKSSQSEVARDLAPYGIKELRTPPGIIEKDKK